MDIFWNHHILLYITEIENVSCFDPFFMGHPLCFSQITGAVILLKIGCPREHVLDDRTTANFEH